MRPILGIPMLALQIERLKRCATLDRLIIATSVDESDAPIADLAHDCGVELYRGSLEDVLDRFYQAAIVHQPETVVRFTGDCPLADWVVIDQVIAFAAREGYDVATNAIRRTFPKGLDVEVVRMEALLVAWREATSEYDREHVLEYLYRQPHRFKLGSFESDRDLSGLRWTVDEPADFELVRSIYEALYPANPEFTTADILDYIKARPEVSALNAHLPR